MFKKPPRLKPLTPLRSSARRSFLAHLQGLYPVLSSAPPEVILQVVPDGLKHCNAITSSEQKAVIYTDDHGKPLWFEVGSDAGAALQQSQQKKNNGKSGQGSQTRLFEVFPTVYVLFILPNLLPRLPTWPQLVESTLCSGSALMLPGLILPPDTFPEAQTSNVYPPASSIIAITPYPSPIPWVVARSELGMEEMCKKRAAGEKGKAATTMHSKGDFLWEMGGKEEPPGLEEGAKIEEALRAHARLNEPGEDLADQLQQDLMIESCGEGATENAEAHIDDTFSTAEVDAIMQLAFLQALVKASKQDNGLPVPLSSFFSSQVLPNRPAYWPPRDAKGRFPSRLPSRLLLAGEIQEERIVTAECADIKHTSAKKLTKWIKSYEKNDLIKCRETKGKEVVITHINALHEDLKDLAPFYTISQMKQADDAGDEGGRTSKEIPATTYKDSSTIIVVERFWRASASSVKLFQEMGAPTSQALSQPLNTKGKTVGDVVEASAENEFIGAIVRGAARPINVEIKTRQGKKIVSLITGLEIYGIDSEAFAHDLMKIGASASATALPGSNPKAPKYEVFVQGDQRKAIVDFLEKRGINRHIVQVHDGTKK